MQSKATEFKVSKTFFKVLAFRVGAKSEKELTDVVRSGHIMGFTFGGYRHTVAVTKNGHPRRCSVSVGRAV